MSENMGLKLFPPPPPPAKRNRSRRPSTRRPAVIPQSPPQSAVEQRAKSPDFSTLIDGRHSALDGRQSSLGERQSPSDGRTSALGGRASPVNKPPPIAQTGSDIPRSHTSFSEALTLVRSNSNSSYTSTSKNETSTSPAPPQRPEPILRSIFPTYNPNLPLEHQPYYPTQTSPTHIPKTVISKRPYTPSIKSSVGLRSPIALALGTSPGQFPRDILETPAVLEPSNTDELKELWKVTNGWRVSSSEGRSFCLKLTSSVEEPVYTLSSSTQPFYTLRLDPTSTSAQMTLTRLDPNKPSITRSSLKALGGSSRSDPGIEVLSTTLEESARRLPPNDGLVALLYPRAASKMAIDLANKLNHADEDSIIAAAEREIGRLVWDEDSKKTYLVHSASSSPFVVCIKSSPAWSRIEYTLEHPELPHNLVKLVRDGVGGGSLEVDTGVAARIDCFYIVDVAICAILLTSIAEEKKRNLERFEGPPSITPLSPKKKRTSRTNIEEMEMDLESQDSIKDRKERDKLPKSTRGLLSFIWIIFRCVIWSLTMTVKAAAAIIVGISKCLTSDKL